MTTKQYEDLETQLNRVGDWHPNDNGYEHRMSGESIRISNGDWEYKNDITEEALSGESIDELIALAKKMADEEEAYQKQAANL